MTGQEAERAKKVGRRQRAMPERFRRLRARDAAAIAAQCTAASKAPLPTSCSGWPAHAQVDVSGENTTAGIRIGI